MKSAIKPPSKIVDLQNKIQKEILLKRVINLKELFDNGNVPTLLKHDVNPGLPLNDRINYIYFTLPVSLNFQRSSPAMWQAALNTYNDPETNYLFYPELVANEKREKIQADLVKHKLALQKNKHTDIWMRISETFNKNYKDDPREFLAKYNYDVPLIIEALQQIEKKDFPYLSGNKMANYWLFILSRFTDINLLNINKISIIPDTHVIQCSVHLGLVDEKAKPEYIAQQWFELLEGSGINPLEMHPVLWNWSRAGFEPGV